MNFSQLVDCAFVEKAYLNCKEVHIGSLKIVGDEKVIITEFGIKFDVSTPQGELVTIKLLKTEIIKILVHFSLPLPVIIYYPTNHALLKLRNQLKMFDFDLDPLCNEDRYKRLILLPKIIPREMRLFIKDVYDRQCLIEDVSLELAREMISENSIQQSPSRRNNEELVNKEADHLLVKEQNAADEENNAVGEEKNAVVEEKNAVSEEKNAVGEEKNAVDEDSLMKNEDI